MFDGKPVELLEESTWTARLRKTGNDTGQEVLCFLEFGDVFAGPVPNFLCQCKLPGPLRFNISALLRVLENIHKIK